MCGLGGFNARRKGLIVRPVGVGSVVLAAYRSEIKGLLFLLGGGMSGILEPQ